MPTLKQQLCVVIPTFNEEEVIVETCNRLLSTARSIEKYDTDLIFVDDGSTDGTVELLRKMAEKNSCIRVICLTRNFGHQMAVTAGIDYADGNFIAIIDADLQDPPELIPEMLKIAEQGYDVVHGTRKTREGEIWFKKFSANAFYRLLNSLADVDIPIDTGDFRLISRRVADELQLLREKHRFLRGLIPWLGFKAYQLDYTRRERYAGETKYPLKKMTRLAFDAIVSFSAKPLEMVVRLGAVVTISGFFGLMYVVFLKVTADLFLAGMATVICLIIIFGGMQITLMGLIGLYVSRIFEETKQRPLYIVSEIIEGK